MFSVSAHRSHLAGTSAHSPKARFAAGPLILAHTLVSRKLLDERRGRLPRRPWAFVRSAIGWHASSVQSMAGSPGNAPDLAPDAMAPVHRNHRRQVDEWVRARVPEDMAAPAAAAWAFEYWPTARSVETAGSAG